MSRHARTQQDNTMKVGYRRDVYPSCATESKMEQYSACSNQVFFLHVHVFFLHVHVHVSGQDSMFANMFANSVCKHRIFLETP